MARHDALTNLPNRTYFREKLEDALSRVGRGTQVAVFCLDLDRFKSVNDTLGHPVGDLLLQAAADRMRLIACATRTLVARLGGDEFAIVRVSFRRRHRMSARFAARLIHTVIGAPDDLDGHQVIVGASIGIAVAPGDGDKPGLQS